MQPLIAKIIVLCGCALSSASNLFIFLDCVPVPVTLSAPPIRPAWHGLIHAYRDFLPVSDRTPVVTLYEGNTPLIPVPQIAARIGRNVSVYVKYDGLNPTGSFKDRGMTMAISKAKEAGAEAVICASTGNTSAAAAAYARRAGLRAYVLVPEGYVAQGKLAQALLYGAEVIAIEGNFDKALEIVRLMAETYPVTLVNSVNPYRLEGQKTAAFEVVDSLGNAPDWLCIPMGNAGNITAYWMGFCQYREQNRCDRLPRMMGFQAAGSAPLSRVRLSPIRKRLRRPFVLVILPTGNGRSLSKKPVKEPLRPSPMRRSSMPIACWPPRKAFSVNLLVRLLWRVS